MSKGLLEAADCVKKVFLENCNSDQLIKGKALEDLIQREYGEVIKNPKNPEVVSDLLKKAEPYKTQGMPFKVYLALFCEICEFHFKGEIGVKED